MEEFVEPFLPSVPHMPILHKMTHYMLNHQGKTVGIGLYNLTYPAGRGRAHFVRLHFPRTKQKGCDLYIGIKAQLGVLC